MIYIHKPLLLSSANRVQFLSLEHSQRRRIVRLVKACKVRMRFLVYQYGLGREFDSRQVHHVSVAQSVEHLTFNQRVESSNLSRDTIYAVLAQSG